MFVFPIFALAQASSGEAAGRSEERRQVRPTATLTTMDTLDPKDFAQPVPAVKPETVKKNSTVKASGSESVPAAAATIQPEVIGTMKRTGAATTPVEPVNQLVTTTNQVSTGDAKLDGLVAAAATRYALDPKLIVAVMRQESSFNPRAVSPKGARGLMQLMPATAARFGVRDIYDPAQNIEGGAQYLRFLLDTFNGNVELALAGYNAGENAVVRYGNRIPPYRETIDYVQRISAHYSRLSNNMSFSSKVSLPQPAAERYSEPILIRSGRILAQY